MQKLDAAVARRAHEVGATQQRVSRALQRSNDRKLDEWAKKLM